MSTPVETSLPGTDPSWKDNLVEALRQEKATGIYVLKALLCLFLTGWFAMRFNLSGPSAAMLTSVLIMNRQSGMIIAKSFYRTLGTLVGGAASIGLMALFGQHRVLFLLGFAGWIAVCVGAAGYMRNFKSYGFLLAGYTTCFVTLTTYTNPLNVFSATIARVSEVLLAIIITTIIFEVIYPVRMGSRLWQVLGQQYTGLFKYLQSHINGEQSLDHVQATHTDFVKSAVEAEDLRSSAIFESTEIAARSVYIERVNEWYMRTTTSLHTLHMLILRSRKRGLESSMSEAMALYTYFVDAIGDAPKNSQEARALLPVLAQCRQVIEIRAAANPLMKKMATEESAVFDATIGLLLRIIGEIESYCHANDRLYHRHPRIIHLSHTAFSRVTDIAPSIINGARVFFALLLSGAFWLYSGWSTGQYVLLNIGIYCALFASSPNPSKVTWQVAHGYTVGFLAAFIYIFSVRPLMDGYLLMFASFVPFILIALIAMTHPKLASFGLGYAICLVYIVGFKNYQTYDVDGFINEAIAQMFGIWIAAISFMLVPAAGSFKWVIKRVNRQMYRLVNDAAVDELEGLNQRFESGSRDLFNQLVSVFKQDTDSALVARGLAINDIGQTLIEIRYAVSNTPRLQFLLRKKIRASILLVAMFYKHPRQERYEQARKVVGETDLLIRTTPTIDKKLRHHFHILYQTLLDSEELMLR